MLSQILDMKILNIKILIISILFLPLFSGCSDPTEPLIEYHNDFSFPLDTLKTYQYAVYSRDRELLLSCISEERRQWKREFHINDPDLNKVNRNIIYFDLDKAKVTINTIEGKEKATINYEISKDKGMEYWLYKDDNRWYID